MFGWRKREPARGDPGPSPVGWLSDEIWRTWNEHDPEAADLKTPHGGPITDAWPAAVSADDHRRAKVAPVPAGALVPPPGTLGEHATLLDSTTGSGYLRSVRWPVCCDRLTTLRPCDLELERATGPLDDALTDAHGADGDLDELRGRWRDTLAQKRAGKHGGDGMELFQCRTCGRVYGATSRP